MMNSKQRMLAALACEQPDRVPVWEMYRNGSSIVKIAQLMGIDIGDVSRRQDLTGQEGEVVIDM